MAAATVQEAGHLVVPEPMAQSCAPEEILRALTPENCRLVALIPSVSTAKHHGAVQVGGASAAERIPLLGGP